LAYFFLSLWNTESETLVVVFYYTHTSTIHFRKPGRTRKDQGKGEKQIMNDQRVLETSKWNKKPASVNTSHLPKKM
jgi:hypothetical protein